MVRSNLAICTCVSLPPPVSSPTARTHSRILLPNAENAAHGQRRRKNIETCRIDPCFPASPCQTPVAIPVPEPPSLSENEWKERADEEHLSGSRWRHQPKSPTGRVRQGLGGV